MSHPRPHYLRVFGTFLRNSLVRDMTYRSNFIINAVAALGWVGMQAAFYLLIFEYTVDIAGWNEFQFFVFLGTALLVNSVVQTFFMPNATEFSELIRTGNLDFALLKPIDTQFLVSLQKVDWSSLALGLFGGVMLGYSVVRLEFQPTAVQLLLYPLYLACGVLMFYSLTIVLSSTSVWMGRNQSLAEFWFYITNFSRYPMEIYRGPLGTPLQWTFTWLIPILVVVNVPARLLAKPLVDQDWRLAAFALAVTAVSLVGSRWVFYRALDSYRSASS